MTLDEAIKHAEEVAKEQRELFSLCPIPSDSCDPNKDCASLKNGKNKGCIKCAKEHEQLAEWLKELKQLREQTRWIPVSERLPETNVYDEHGPVWKHEVLIKGYLSFDDKKEKFITTALAEDVRNKCVPNTNVTAWMPLPASFEPQESEG